jgi:preprotein translocase subunit SecG
MIYALITVHVLVAFSLVLIVLLQTGRGAELGAAFGGMGQATYGRSQSTFISKFTTGLAVVFMATSLSLAFLSTEHQTESILSEVTTSPAAPTAPATPAATVPAAPVEQPARPGDEQAAAPAPTLPQTDAPRQPSAPAR